MKIIKYWKPILVAALICYGSLTSGNNLNKVSIFHIHNMDKFIHLFLYFLLSVSLISSLFRNTYLKRKEQKIITAVLVISYGLLMEVFQYYFTKDRSPELLDAVANMLGCFIALLFFPFFVKLNIIKYL